MAFSVGRTGRPAPRNDGRGHDSRGRAVPWRNAQLAPAGAHHDVRAARGPYWVQESPERILRERGFPPGGTATAPHTICRSPGGPPAGPHPHPVRPDRAFGPARGARPLHCRNRPDPFGRRSTASPRSPCGASTCATPCTPGPRLLSRDRAVPGIRPGDLCVRAAAAATRSPAPPWSAGSSTTPSDPGAAPSTTRCRRRSARGANTGRVHVAGAQVSWAGR